MGAGPLTSQELKFVNWFRKYRNSGNFTNIMGPVYRAAERVRIPKNQAKRTYERLEVQEEIERQDLVVEQERARQQVAAEGITRDLLDAELYTVIKLSPKTHSTAKLKAIEMGYIRAGVLQGTLKSMDLTPPNPDDEVAAPTVYQAVFTMASPAAPIVPPSAPIRAPEETIKERVRTLTTPPQPAAPVPEPTKATAALPAAYPRAGRISR